MRNTGLVEAQAGIKIAGRNIKNLRYADDTTLMAESEEVLKSLSMKVKEESEKVGWKLNTKKIKIIASSPITSWQIDGETVETVEEFIFGWFQNHCRWWLQPWNEKMLAPWKESYGQPRQHIKSRCITLPTKAHLVKAMVFPVVMYGCDIWTIKLSTEDWCFWCGVGEDSWESLGLHRDPTSPS